MNIEKSAAKVSKSHVKYRLKDGFCVPGVTTITGVMDKPALVKWANGLGLKGIDSTKYVDNLANVGSLAHDIIHCHLTKQECDTSMYSKDQIDLAETCVIKWHYWADSKEISVIGSEMPLVSEKHQFGGTCDLYAKVDGVNTLIDLKTCKGIYDEQFTQVAGYKLLLEEAGYTVDQCMIVRIGRNDDEGEQPEVKTITNIDLHIQRFLICRSLYAINARIRKDV